MSTHINVDAAREALDRLAFHARGCPCAQRPVSQAAIDAHHQTIRAALNELERAQPVVGMFKGRKLTISGDEISVYATAEECNAIGRAVKG